MLKVLKSKIIEKLRHSHFIISPKQTINNYFLNLLGLQVLRLIWANLFRLHPKKVAPEYKMYADILERDGILVIEDFLPQHMFDELKSDSASLRSKASTIMHDTTMEIKVEANTLAYIDYVRNNQLILELVSAFTHRRMNRKPQPYVWQHQKRIDVETVKDSSVHSSHFAHTDKHYPIFKVFYTLSDIDKDNGAFTYYKTSHKLSWWRLLFEYKFSVAQSLLWKESKNPLQIYDPEKIIESAGFKPTPMEGKANTLVLANTMGFHRRGEFYNTNPREYAHLDFNYLESLYSRLKYLFKRDDR
jgi:hypothetical protein